MQCYDAKLYMITSLFFVQHQITEAVVSEHFQEFFGPDIVFSLCIRSHFEKEGGYQNGYGFVSFFSIDKREEIVNKTFRKDNVKYEFRPIRNNHNIKRCTLSFGIFFFQ